MRRLLLAAVSLFATILHAQEKWVESPVTLALTLTHSGEETLTPGKNNTATRSVPLITERLGNKEILAALVTAGDITETKGWRLVAIWAYWPDQDPYSGNAYRFYARKGGGANMQTVPVPSSILSVEPLVTAVGVKHTIQGEEGTILSGRETYKVYTRLRFGVAGIVGDPQGVQSGTGKYVKIAGQSAGRYVPNTSKIPLAGLFSSDGESAEGVVGGSIAFGAGKFVTSYDYEAPGGTSYGSVSYSSGALLLGSVGSIGAIDATGTLYVPGNITSPTDANALGLVKQGSLTLDLTDANTYTGVTTVNAGTLAGTGTITALGNFTFTNSTTFSGLGTITSGHTFIVGSGATTTTLNFPPYSTGTIVFVSGGTLELSDGAILSFAPGESIDLSTLSADQIVTGVKMMVPPSSDTPAETTP